jgi:hypothetical protein
MRDEDSFLENPTAQDKATESCRELRQAHTHSHALNPARQITDLEQQRDLWLPVDRLTTMARAYSNGNDYSSSPYGGSGGSSSQYSYDAHPSRRHDESIWDDIYAWIRSTLAQLWRYCSGPGRIAAANFAMQTGQHMRRNLSWRRVLSFPHLVVLLWVIVMLWGEKWVFSSRVASCDWDHWEKWASGHFDLFREPVAACRSC